MISLVGYVKKLNVFKVKLKLLFSVWFTNANAMKII